MDSLEIPLYLLDNTCWPKVFVTVTFKFSDVPKLTTILNKPVEGLGTMLMFLLKPPLVEIPTAEVPQTFGKIIKLALVPAPHAVLILFQELLLHFSYP